MFRLGPTMSRRLATNRQNKTARRFDGSSSRVRLLVYGLEYRTVPASITINSIGDNTLIDGKVTLREAQQSANFNVDINADVTLFRIGAYGAETLVFDAALFATPQVIAVTGGQLELTGDTIIQGTSAANVSVVRTGAGISRVFVCNVAGMGNLSFSNMTISGANQTGVFGGGISGGDDSVTVTNCVISNNVAVGGAGLSVTTGGTLNLANSTISGNSASNGGGIYCYKASLIMNDCTVSGNSTGSSGAGLFIAFGSKGTISNSTIGNNTANTNGGGLLLGGSTMVTIQNSTIAGNTAKSQNGGGIACYGTLLIESTTIASNTADNNGGGLAVRAGSTLSIDNCAITGNSAGIEGGGIYQNSGASGTLRNSTISGNGAPNGGGGILLKYSALMTLQNCTVAFNSAFFGGGGASVNAMSKLTIESTIIAKNTCAGSPDVKNGVATTTSLIGDTTGSVPTGAPLTGDPMLAPLANYGGPTPTHALLAGSPALNVGSNPAALSTDQRGPGFVRVFAGNADIGAFETQLVSFTVLNANDSGVGSLRQAILNSNANPGDDTITFDPAFFSVAQTIKLGGTQLPITDQVTVIGPGSGLATISGENKSRVFEILVPGAGQSVTISDLTIRNGVGIGGGIFIGDDALTLTRCVLSNNTSNGNGGAIAVTAGGVLLLDSCTLSGNSAMVNGGGVHFFTAVPSGITVVNCTISENSAGTDGGGIHAFNVGPNSKLAITNSTISTNSAGISGGGIVSQSTTVAVDNSTITNNSAGIFGGGIGAFASPVSIGSSIVSGNINAFSPDIDAGNVNINWSAIGSTKGFTLNGTNNVPFNAKLKLGPLQDNGGPTKTHLPDFDSPLIDQGTSGGLSFDQRGIGYIRSVGAGTDIGAVEAFTIDPNPPTVVIGASAANINDFKVGSNALTITATFNEPMNTTIAPSVSFPVENPFPSIAFASGSWTSNKVYEAKFNVFDLNANLQDIDVRVSGGQDAAGNVHGQTTLADLIDLDTQNPIVVTMTRDDPSPTNLATVGWTVTFSEGVGGVTAGNFVLFNGGLTGSPTITSVMGGGTTWTVKASTGGGEGTLALYVTSTTGVTDGAGNPLAALPVIGPAYAIDHVMPQAAKLTTNTLTVTDFNIGPAGFQVTVEFNEPMNQSINPTVSFPVENPAPTLTFGNGVWLNAKTYRANYTVADVGATLNDIDIAVSGAEDAVGNVQAPLAISDLFDIDMASPTVSTVKINSGATQRSRVTAVEVNFDRHVTFSGTPAAAFQLQRQSDGKLPNLAAAVNDTGPTTIVTLTFSGTNAVDFTSLADGRYTMTIFANQVSSGGGILDGNGNGVGGDNYVLASEPNTMLPPTNIFRLFGDFNADGTVAANDFIQFRLALGGTSSIFDFDNDGAVAASDFIQFRLRFGGSI